MEQDYNCGQDIHTSQRGASNIYFPVLYSSIYLPLWAEKEDREIIAALEDPEIWSTLTSSLEDGKILRLISDAVAAARHLDRDKVYKAACKKFEGKESSELPTSEEGFRYAEYDAFLNERGSVDADLYVAGHNIDEYETWMNTFFRRVVLVKKLRETRVLAGFTRLLPPGEREDQEGQYDRQQSIKLSNEIRWLPAVAVRGEGIFIEFNELPIKKWLQSSSASSRVTGLFDKFNKNKAARGIEPTQRSAKFLMLHSFAHILIRQLCFDCGYGSAALRERIYCDRASTDSQMQGILIYTAAGDSEGTMGGLVRQGEPSRLENSIRRALQEALWCAADPVCIESLGQGTNNSNLAACHNCCLLPETSCEHGNHFLDRALLIGKPSDEGLGFFKYFLKS